MSIATRTGDDGTTSLLFGRRVSKTHPRVEAYGTVDELSAALGLARATCPEPAAAAALLQIQKDLLQLCGELATADEDRRKFEGSPFPGLRPENLAFLDRLVAAHEASVPPLRAFVQPGSSVYSAHLHHARTVCRRAERSIWVLRESGGLVPDPIPQYLNRLSDTLWLMARADETGTPVAPA